MNTKRPWSVPARCLQATILFILWTSAASADPPPDYYDSVDAATPASLRITLHETIDDHMRFPYTSGGIDTWVILEEADQDPENPGSILDLYKNAIYPKAGEENGNYTREHTWPRSYGFPDDTVDNYPLTDCHALFLANGSYNGSRGYTLYRTCNSPSCSERPTEANHGRGGGSGVYPGNSNWRQGVGTSGTWETWKGRRGDVARALFYMDVRYAGGFHGVTGDDEPDLILTNDLGRIVTFSDNAPVAYMGLLSTLLQWHQEDPVDPIERDHNEAVASFQGNRNPFVDHPEWAACLYQEICVATGPCLPGPATLCLNGGRFEVRAAWEKQGTEGDGQAVPLTSDTGYFWFFASTNVEVVVKVLDGCGLNQHFWVFAGGLTDVHTVLTVRDTQTGSVKTYENPAGTPFQPIQDTKALATCSGTAVR